LNLKNSFSLRGVESTKCAEDGGGNSCQPGEICRLITAPGRGLDNPMPASPIPDPSNTHAWLSRRLHPLDAEPPVRGYSDLNPGWEAPGAARAAAVLVPVVDRETPTVLLTVRSAGLSSHAGQIAFPGGRIDASDPSIVDAALRETWEETGITGDYVTPLGLLDAFETGTNFRIHPVVAMVRPGFTATPNPGEVAELFEAPLAYLMDVANHEIHTGTWNGAARRFHAITYKDHYIWGATAAILVDLYRRLQT
jgi:8-oxo-dGTP pyrophosphatase MutT (NUDIX family)